MEARAKLHKLLMVMTMDDIMGKGPTPKAMIANLRIVADELEKMLPEDGDEEGREP